MNMRKVSSAAGGLAILSLLVTLWGCAHSSGGYYPPSGQTSDGMLQWQELRVVDLNMYPDPIREGTRVRFYVEVLNRSHDAGRVSFYVYDVDKLIVSVHNVAIRPGQNRVAFPQTNYRFHKEDHCFVVKVNIKGNEYPIDMAKKYCAYKTHGGWSLQ